MKCALIVLSLLLLSVPSKANDNWPQWRGPFGNGSSDSKNLPTIWSTNKNILWKTELPSWSGSTPIVWGHHIFLTTPSKFETNVSAQIQIEPNRDVGGSYGVNNPGGNKILLLAIDRKNGHELWRRELDRENKLFRKGNSASPSPVTDGQHVWAVTGNGLVTAFDMDGQKIWSKDLKEYGKFSHAFGYNSSPIFVDGKLILQMLQAYGQGGSYVLALDGATGRELWKQDRPTDAISESPDAHTTPALLVHNGQKQIVVNGGDYVTGHDLQTGREIWRGGGLNPRKSPYFRVIPSVTIDNNLGLIFTPSRLRPFIAYRAGGHGDITEQSAWKYDAEGGSDVSSPVSDGTHLYFVADNGAVTCLNATTGKRLYGPERTTVGTVNASPLFADGKIYITNERAITTVLAAGPQFKILATNQLDGRLTLSSLAVAGDQIFLRTATHLYCIAQL